MNFLATNPSDAFNTVIWTLIIPAIFVASLVAFMIPILVKKLEHFVTRMFRVSPKQAPPVKNSVSKANIPVCAAEDSAPNCPTCNRVMVVRLNRRGEHKGSSFWGCPAYPNCRGTRNIEIR